MFRRIRANLKQFIFSCLAIIIIVGLIILATVLGYNYYQSNQDVAALMDQNHSIAAELDDERELTAQLQEQVADLEGGEECAVDTVDIVRGTYQIPCGWHSYFELRFTDVNSYGYADDGPLYLLFATDQAVGKVSIQLTEHSDSLGNYTSTPLADKMSIYSGSSATIEDMTNQKGVEFKKVTNYSKFLGGNVTLYFAENSFISNDKPHTDLITFSNNKIDVDYAGDLVDTFQWK